MSSVEDLININPVPILIPAAVVDEFLRHGASIYEILDTSTDGSPGHTYSGATGYEFEWGHIIETNTIGTPEIEGGALCNWEFCLNTMLKEYQLAGSHLSELADVAMWYLGNLENSPTFVSMGDGDTISAFDLHAFNEDIIKSRQWICKSFVPNHLPRMLELMRDHLALPDSRIPLREPPCRMV